MNTPLVSRSGGAPSGRSKASAIRSILVLMRYLRANRPHLAVTLAGTMFSTAFALGSAWTLAGSRIAGAERRLDEIDTAHVAETRWQVQQQTAALSAVQIDARHTAAQIAEIDTRLGVIESKLDAIAEAVKARR